MRFGSPQMLVVDNEEDEGIRIAKALWEEGMAATFISYDERTLQRAARKKLRGVRVVFMDINLLGGPMGQDQMNFSAVQTSIVSLLDIKNGPYLLITWTTHDDLAQRLFKYLEERLPEELRPAATARLDKTDFQGRRSAALRSEVQKRLVSADYFTLLWMWESGVFEGAALVTDQVTVLAKAIDGGKPNSIGTVLKALATAEAGKRLTLETATRSYSSVLNQILFDSTEAGGLEAIDPELVKRLLELGDGSKEALWKRHANRMINIDETEQLDVHQPGDVYNYPDHVIRGRRSIPNLEHETFMIENFVRPDFARGKADIIQQKKDVVRQWKLVLVEVTPPCDHAQAKGIGHRYVVGVEMSESDTGSKGALPSKGDYLMRLPAMQLTGDAVAKCLVLNSRLVISVSTTDIRSLKKRKYRLRGQLLGDVIGWLARQQSRIGHVYLS